MICCGSSDAFASKPAPTFGMRSTCGSGLAREGAISHNKKNHEGVFSIRNALALASTSKYITTVINNGSRK